MKNLTKAVMLYFISYLYFVFYSSLLSDEK